MKTSTIQRKIREQNAGWTARGTSRSGFSAKELRDGHSGTLVVPNALDLSAELYNLATRYLEALDGQAKIAPPPPCFDWLTSHNVITSADDQSPGDVRCNSCVAFAVCSTIEARMNIITEQPAGAVRLSRHHLFFGGCGLCCSQGWSTRKALEKSRRSGIPGEDQFPYDPGTTTVPPSALPIVTLRRFARLESATEIKRAIASKGPVIADMDLYEDFKDYDDGIYRPVTPKVIGFHTVSIVGYCDTPGENQRGYWICKNSWGTDWGFEPVPGIGRGFFKIEYEACRIGSAHDIYDCDPDVPLPQHRAIAIIDEMIAAARDDSSLRSCLRRVSRGLPPAICSDEDEQAGRLAKDIIRMYPELRQKLKDGLNG